MRADGPWGRASRPVLRAHPHCLGWQANGRALTGRATLRLTVRAGRIGSRHELLQVTAHAAGPDLHRLDRDCLQSEYLPAMIRAPGLSFRCSSPCRCKGSAKAVQAKGPHPRCGCGPCCSSVRRRVHVTGIRPKRRRCRCKRQLPGRSPRSACRQPRRSTNRWSHPAGKRHSGCCSSPTGSSFRCRPNGSA